VLSGQASIPSRKAGARDPRLRRQDYGIMRAIITHPWPGRY
jgi:hypothetical protein